MHSTHISVEGCGEAEHENANQQILPILPISSLYNKTECLSRPVSLFSEFSGVQLTLCRPLYL